MKSYSGQCLQERWYHFLENILISFKHILMMCSRHTYRRLRPIKLIYLLEPTFFWHLRKILAGRSNSLSCVLSARPEWPLSSSRSAGSDGFHISLDSPKKDKW